jgi:hypothetical protein
MPRKNIYVSPDDLMIWETAEHLAPDGNMSQLVTRLLREHIPEEKFITGAEECAAIALLRRERDLQTETVQVVLDWNRQWQGVARERDERIRQLINENIQLRNELTAPVMQRPGIQDGLAKCEELEQGREILYTPSEQA